jgi:hypothetical protein
MQHGSIARRPSWAAIDWLAVTHGEALDASELQEKRRVEQGKEAMANGAVCVFALGGAIAELLGCLPGEGRGGLAGGTWPS